VLTAGAAPTRFASPASSSRIWCCSTSCSRTSGNEVCKQLERGKGTEHIPVIMATARGEEIDRVLGLELGADDYVMRPFSVRELLLRASRPSPAVTAIGRRPPAAPSARCAWTATPTARG
jgi:DNA-binding NarL/FixJ family response regulator